MLFRFTVWNLIFFLLSRQVREKMFQLNDCRLKTRNAFMLIRINVNI